MGMFRIKTREGHRGISSLYLVDKKIPESERDQMRVEQQNTQVPQQPQQPQFQQPTPMVSSVPKRDTRIEVKDIF